MSEAVPPPTFRGRRPQGSPPTQHAVEFTAGRFHVVPCPVTTMGGRLMEDGRFSEPLPASTQVLYRGVNGDD